MIFRVLSHPLTVFIKIIRQSEPVGFPITICKPVVELPHCSAMIKDVISCIIITKRGGKFGNRFLATFFGDDIYYTTHGIGSIKNRRCPFGNGNLGD